MTTLRNLVTLVFLSAIFLFLAHSVLALDTVSLLGEGRYFIKSESGIIQKLFGARHSFPGGFTTNLTKGELWTLEKIFRLPIERVPLYKIAGEGDPEETDAFVRTHAPESALDWGADLLGDSSSLDTAEDNNILIALLDTGVYVNHPDLQSRITSCVDFTRSGIVTNTCNDEHGHGTHLAGIIAADGGPDGNGKLGIAPNSSLLIYKTCNAEGFCWADDIAAAIAYTVEEGADIVLIGGVGGEASSLVENALLQAGDNSLVVAPAGNTGPAEESIQYPAAYQEVVAVGAIDNERDIPEWSARGVNDGDFEVEPGEIEFVSPGVDIESTWLNGEYRYLSGTSLASAFVTALAGRVWTGETESTRLLLQSISEDIGQVGDDDASGFGLPVLP